MGGQTADFRSESPGSWPIVAILSIVAIVGIVAILPRSSPCRPRHTLSGGLEEAPASEGVRNGTHRDRHAFFRTGRIGSTGPGATSATGGGTSWPGAYGPAPSGSPAT